MESGSQSFVLFPSPTFSFPLIYCEFGLKSLTILVLFILNDLGWYELGEE